MKCNSSWLREWVPTKLTLKELCSKLTMAGLEVESIEGEVIEVAITPNRGDCLSVRGIARELSAITKTPLKEIKIVKSKPTIKDSLPIQVSAQKECPRYLARIIRNVKADAETPEWLKQRLISGGIKIINPIVDVTNYVMLELGQPMHAFDLGAIQKHIQVRLSKKGEKITLLDNSHQTLNNATLVIADEARPLAIAGVMGGLDSGVTLNTKDILLESAYFSPETIAKQRQQYGLNSDSAYRFERGVDYTIQDQAIERATQLILAISGGNPGPVVEKVAKPTLPKKRSISLNPLKIEKVLGFSIPKEDILKIFKFLNFSYKIHPKKWIVEVPSYRFDLSIEEDLIEEIVRLYGYEKVKSSPLKSVLENNDKVAALSADPIRHFFKDQGYQEIISYSFVDRILQEMISPEKSIELVNPITSEMSVMRTSLWPGLMNSFNYNKSRQQNRIRLFEIGAVFAKSGDKINQVTKVAGLVSGLAYQEQWGASSKAVDFFDVKGDIENLISGCCYKPETHPALHPGQTAGIYIGKQRIGILGALHPEVLKVLGLSEQIMVFELELDHLLKKQTAKAQELSKFPEIRRDVAILIKQTIPAQEIQDTIKKCAGDWLKETFIFDVYQGKGITPGAKSIAVALVFQHPTRTLKDEEVTAFMEQVIEKLKRTFGAELRS